MASNDYHFITHWHVRGTRDEVGRILADGPGLVRWWPSVYLEVRQLKAGDANGLGAEVDLYTRGWLPYTLRWWFRVVDSHPPEGFTIEAHGDFEGRGIWTLEQHGDWVDITYDWLIRADKPLLRNFSWLMKPIFAANHRWAMARGEESLKLELARRRASTPADRALIPAPPGPVRSKRMLAAAGAGIGLLLVGMLAGRRRGAAEVDDSGA